jgi:prevent-host-death family protein
VKNVSISVTEASRNFADCINRVRYQNTTFVLVKNGTPVARLVPTSETICTGRGLLEALAGIELSAEETEAWRKDLEDARQILKPPVNKWR